MSVEFEKIMKRVTTVLAIGLSLFTLYTAVFGLNRFQRPIHLCVILVLGSLQYHISPKGLFHNDRFESISKIILSLLAILSSAWVIIRWDDLAYIPFLSNTDLILGVVLTIIILDISRRTLGISMPLITILFLTYAFWGNYFPGILFHKAFTLSRIMYEIYPGETGIFSIPIGVCATYIILFMLFSSFLQISGGTDIFINIANALYGSRTGGPAKVAVVSSGLMGMISGSAVANVATTGAVTIPLMKRLGFHPNVAGAVEATASTGGQIMPPIMGATAFVIADLTGTPYIKLCAYAAIPAVFYYYAVYLSVHYYSRKMGLSGLRKDDLPNLWASLRKGTHLFFPIGILVLLLSLRYSTMMSVVWSIIALVALANIRSYSRLNFPKIAKALESGAKDMVPLSSACACAGIIAGVVNLTGVGFNLSYSLLELSGGIPLVLLFLIMVITLVLSMGLPPVACYIILIILMGPALEKLGFNQIASHMFIFYFSALSTITPPYCLAAYTGAAIAGGNPFKTGFIAWKIALSMFIVPFLFVYFPELLLQGTFWAAGVMIFKSIIGIFSFVSGIEGYIFAKLNALERIVLFLLCYLLFQLNGLLLLIPLVIFGTTILYLRSKRSRLMKER